MRILIADDTKTNLAILTASLMDLGHEVIPVDSGEKAIESFKTNRPDLIILDVVMEGIDGFECAKRIRELSNDDWIPIIFLSSSVDDQHISRGIDAGGDDYLAKPFSQITLAAKIKAMQRISDMRKKLFIATQQLSQLSVTDALTGLYNRLEFEKIIKQKIAESDRYQRNIALFFIDLDYFKVVNDTWGHHIGDLLLVEVAKRLKGCLRSSDFIARMGGDEFAIILNQIENKDAASSVAKNIISVITKEFILDKKTIKIGVSIGIALYPSPIKNYENLVNNADSAMYKAKAAGRNNFLYFDDHADKIPG